MDGGRWRQEPGGGCNGEKSDENRGQCFREWKASGGEEEGSGSETVRCRCALVAARAFTAAACSFRLQIWASCGSSGNMVAVKVASTVISRGGGQDDFDDPSQGPLRAVHQRMCMC